MILHLEFAFWSTWQMREQTWHICQAAHNLAKGRSSVSPGPPHDPNFLRAIYGPSIVTKPPRRPLPIASNTIVVVRCRTWYESNTSLIRVVATAPVTSGGEQEELATRPVRKTRETVATLRARRKVVREDDRERAQRKKITAGSALANCQLNYAKPLEIAYF
jgi:hypothetical protein